MNEENKTEIMKEEKNKFIKRVLNLFFWFVTICGTLATLIQLGTLKYFNAFGGLFEGMIALASAVIVFLVLNSARKSILKKITGE